MCWHGTRETVDTYDSSTRIGYLLKTNEFPIQPTNQPTNGNQYFQIETQMRYIPQATGRFPTQKVTASGEPASQRMVKGLRRFLCGVNSLYQSLCIFCWQLVDGMGGKSCWGFRIDMRSEENLYVTWGFQSKTDIRNANSLCFFQLGDLSTFWKGMSF